MRVLQAQTTGTVGLVPLTTVHLGPDEHLVGMGTAFAALPLVTGGSGVALGLPANFVRKGLMKAAEAPQSMAAPKGRAAVLAGSCSEATRGQIAAAKAAGMPSYEIDPLAIAAGKLDVAAILSWADKQSPSGPFLIYSSADPATVKSVQEKLGREQAGRRQDCGK